MAPRTISQIAGELNINRNATPDPFSQEEQAVLKNVKRTLENLRSVSESQSAAKGFGRSTFEEGIRAQQEADVLGQTAAQFARGRTQEALAERQFERGLIGQEAAADIEGRLIGERAQAETGLIGARGTEQRLTLADQIAADVAARERGAELEAERIGLAGEEQRLTLADQLAGQRGLSSQQAQQQLTQLKAQQTGQERLVSQQQEFQAQERLLDRQLTQEENVRLRDFQKTLFDEELQFKGTQADIERTEAKNRAAIDLVLRGNLSQDQVREQVSSLLGEGAVLTPDDELNLQRVAAASGVSTEDYKRIRSAIGTKQGELILGTSREEVPELNDEGQAIFNVDFSKIAGDDSAQQQRNIDFYKKEAKDKFDIDLDSALTDNEIKKIENEFKIDLNPQSRTQFKDIPNINKFIQDPITAQKFTIEMAKAAAAQTRELAEIESETAIAEAEAASSKVLCTELYRQGILPEAIYRADQRQALLVNDNVVSGYHLWGKPLARLMSKSKIITSIVKPFAMSWAYHMAYNEGVVNRPNMYGLALESFGMPLCYGLGLAIKLYKRKKKKKAVGVV